MFSRTDKILVTGANGLVGTALIEELSIHRAFSELAKYAPNSFKMVTIGNHIELANAILSYSKSDFAPHLQKYHESYNIHTSAELYKRLLNQEEWF